jgi:glycine/D-amino acid oxidase-like deaminating enzyme
MKVKKLRMLVTAVFIGASVTSQAATPPPFPKRAYHPGARIAILGAGAGGLAVARSLIDHGVDPHKIEVFEKSESAGGKVKTILVDGRPVELGAQVVVPGVYKPILDLAKKYHLSLRKPDRGLNFDLATGNIMAAPSKEDTLEFFKQLAIYEYRYETRWKSVSDPKGFANIPPELNKSWPEFVKEQGFEKIHLATSAFIGGSGYLAPQALPQAAQMVRILTPVNLLNLALRGTRLFDGGFQTLWKLEAQDLQNAGVTFHYNTEVKGLSRQRDATLVATETNPAGIAFDHVFYTGNLAYLPSLLTEVSEQEKQVYGKVVNNDYRSYVVRVEGLKTGEKFGAFGFMPNTVTAPANHAVLSIKPYADKDVYVIYAYGTPTSTEAEILAGIQSDLARLHAHITEVIDSQKWQYFPHVTSDLGGFFRSVLALQGAGGVWITGEATSFTATIEVYKQGRDFAELFVQNKL